VDRGATYGLPGEVSLSLEDTQITALSADTKGQIAFGDISQQSPPYQYGTSGGYPSSLGNCALYQSGSTLGSENSFLFWSDYAAGGVLRAYFTNGQWGTQQGIWNQPDARVLSVSFQPDNLALYAVTPQQLYLSQNPTAAISTLVTWTRLLPLQDGSVDFSSPDYREAFRGVSILPRDCEVYPLSYSATSTATSTTSASSSPTSTTTATASSSSTATPSASFSAIPTSYTYGNILTTRVEKFRDADDNVLSRVWVDEYSWNGDSSPAGYVQSFHFPYRDVDHSVWTVYGPNHDQYNNYVGKTLTLPFAKSRDLGLGQITASGDACAVSVAGFDLPTTLGSINTGDNKLLVKDYNDKQFLSSNTGYPISVARFGNSGWKDFATVSSAYFHPNDPNHKGFYDQWLPTPPWNASNLLTYADGSQQKPVPQGNQPLDSWDNYVLTARSWDDVPRAAAYTSILDTVRSRAACSYTRVLPLISPLRFPPLTAASHAAQGRSLHRHRQQGKESRCS
jgi:hypothetical protein